MKKRLFIVLLVSISMFSYSFASQEKNKSKNTPDVLPQKIINMEKREDRCEQKQEIKSEVLELYSVLKNDKDRSEKKEIRNQISDLRREIWNINTKIIYSYKSSLVNIFSSK